MVAWAILLAGAVLLGILWPSLPDTWAVHFGADGRPNGWAHKNLLGVYFPLILGAFIIGITQLVKLAARTRQSPWATTPEAARELARMDCRSVDIISAVIALIMVMWSVILPLRQDLVPLAMLVTFGGIALATVLILVNIRRTVRIIGVPKGFSGLAYNNPDDPRLWVPKLSGVGTTLNFANPWAWPVLIAILAGPIGIIALALYQAF